MVKNILFGLVVITAMFGCNGDDEIEITVPDL
jgi:hypothetical protein